MSSKSLAGRTGQEREQLDGAAQCEVGELREHVEVLRSGVAKAHHTKRASYELAAHRACVSFRWMVLSRRSTDANEVEILVLRHQLAVLAASTDTPGSRPNSAR
jgi:hypothetical protein